MHRGKRRSTGQRIGERGEAKFVTWAIENNLSPKKATPDYGIDFFCQVLSSISNKTEEISGEILAVFVRSVEGKNRKRIKVNRQDAENALRTKAPFCFIGMDLINDLVFYRFLDEQLIEILHNFLKSPNNSCTLGFNKFSNDSSSFILKLKAFVKPKVQQKLLWLKAELDIASVVPGGQLKYHLSNNGDLALVIAPWITSMFAVDQKKQREIADIVFEQGTLPNPNHLGISLHREFDNIHNLIDGKILLGGDFEREIEAIIENCGVKKTASFKLRTIGDEWAYISKAGLILVMSAARKIDGQFVHEMRYLLSRNGAVDLSCCKVERDFIRLLRSNSILKFGNKEDSGFGIENWQAGLSRLGTDLETIEMVYNHLNLGLTHIFLADLLDEEFAKSVFFIGNMIKEVNLKLMMPGFIFGPSVEKEICENDWVDVGFRIPVVANLKQKGIVVWVEGVGQAYRSGDGFRYGFKPKRQTNWSCEIKDKRFQKSIDPEAWVIENWPAIPLFRYNKPHQGTFNGDIKHEFGGDVWFL